MLSHQDYLPRNIFINVMAHTTTFLVERLLWVESGRCFMCDRRKFMLDDCYIVGRFMNFRPRMLTLLEWDGLVPRATQITEDYFFPARRRIILSQPVSRWINFRSIKVHSLLTRRDRLGTSTVRQRSARFKDEHYLCYIFPFSSSPSLPSPFPSAGFSCESGA